MGNLRNRTDVRLASHKKDYLKWTSKPNYMSQKILENDSVLIREIYVTLTLNKPAYAGMCMLNFSNVLMYVFHYDYTKNKYGNNSRLLFTDTDSLIFEVKTKDVYEDFSKNKEMFDFSNFSAKLKYYNDSKKLVVGKMKDETASVLLKNLLD